MVSGRTTELRLEEFERNSALWKKIRAHFEHRLQRHRARNDASKSVEETEKLRGRIAECKYILSLGDATESNDPG